MNHPEQNKTKQVDQASNRVAHDYARLYRAMAIIRRALTNEASAEAQAAGCRNALFALDSGGDLPEPEHT